MVLQPKKVKFRKDQRGKRRGIATRGNTLVFGEYGLQILGRGWLKANQIESARKAITHFVKRGGKLWIRVLCDKSATARAAETRMGSGKGDPAYYVAVVKPGKIIFELAGVSREDAKEAMRLAGHKLPIETRLVEKIQ
jgi:large subunit ribosomal protein L16